MIKYLLLCIPLFAFSQKTPVDFITADAHISFDVPKKSVAGDVTYHFEVKSAIDTIRIDAINMVFSNVAINGKLVKFKTSAKELQLFTGYKKGKNTLSFQYTATPKQAIYFVGAGENSQIWTQGQGKYTSHWLPSFDDMTEKVIFNLSVDYDSKAIVIANGQLKDKVAKGNLTTWQFTMDKPMSSYLVMIAAGDFDHKTLTSKSGITVENYYQPEDEVKYEPTYRYTKEIFDYLETEIGVPYPWGKMYRQVPVLDFLYGGMENTTATTFAQDYVVDAIGFNDRNYVNVNAHELAHQWFGDLITAKTGKDHWLQEGFATYYALLTQEHLLGEDFFYNQLYQMAEDLQRVAKTDTIPILNEKASTYSFYKKGAWALHVLREDVGADKFRTAVRNYLFKYAYKNVDTDEFLGEINKVSNYDTKKFKAIWLEQSGFEIEDVIKRLKKNNFMKAYFAILDQANLPFEQKRSEFEKIMVSNAYFPIKQEIVAQTEEVAFSEKESLLKLAMQTQDVKVRQAVAYRLNKVPESFYNDYFSLLDDSSYLTREVVSNNIFNQIPEKRVALLDKTDGNFGFNDHNLRIQWLMYALYTKDYRVAEKAKHYDELLQYSTVNYEAAVRQNALQSLLYLNPNDTNVLPMLISPLTHHKWQFSKFARETIRELLKKATHRKFFADYLASATAAEQIQLQKLLDEK